MEDLPRWGYWAMARDPLIDQELHPGEFLALNDLMAPMEEEFPLDDDANANNIITVSMAPSNNNANSAASANGPLAPYLPDLNMQSNQVEPEAHNIIVPVAQLAVDGRPLKKHSAHYGPELGGYFSSGSHC